jgi:hypothetical protein
MLHPSSFLAMLYTNLITKTTSLSIGRHVIYELGTDRVVIHNMGIAHPYRAPRDEYHLELIVNGRTQTPRFTDFFTDFLLKWEVRLDLHLPLTESCELVCNGADPLNVVAPKPLPDHFSEESQANWTLQTSSYQTAGLPTRVLLCGLQGMIRVYDLTDPNLKAPEVFRTAFRELSQGKPLHEIAKPLFPEVLPGKRYFDAVERTI